MPTALLAALLLVLADLADERIEGIVDAHARLCRRLHERYAILTSHLLCSVLNVCEMNNVDALLRHKCQSQNVLITSRAEFMSTAHACKSHLLPTSTMGTSSASLTRLICSRYVPGMEIYVEYVSTF